MELFLHSILRLLSAFAIKSIAEMILPKGGIGESAKRGINTVMLFISIETVVGLWEGIWSF